MKIKKLTAILLVLAMAFTLAACEEKGLRQSP